MPMYNQDIFKNCLLDGGVGHICGNHLYVRKGLEKAFASIISSVPSGNTYRRKFNGELITRFHKNGEPVKTSDGKYFLVIKRKDDGKDYLSAIQVMEYSPEFLTLV